MIISKLKIHGGGSLWTILAVEKPLRVMKHNVFTVLCAIEALLSLPFEAGPITIPRRTLRAVERDVGWSSEALLRGRLWLPWLLELTRLEPRLELLQSSVERIRAVVRWKTRFSLTYPLERC